METYFKASNVEAKTFFSVKKATDLKSAFDKSIQAWLLRSMGFEMYDTKKSCGLCDMFYNNYCRDCPIYIKTGLNVCRANKHYITFIKDRTPKNAKAELDYLLKLKAKYLPKTVSSTVKRSHKKRVPVVGDIIMITGTSSPMHYFKIGSKVKVIEVKKPYKHVEVIGEDRVSEREITQTVSVNDVKIVKPVPFPVRRKA